MKKTFGLYLLLCVTCLDLSAQVEGLFVERYYVSDSLDSTDPVSGSVLPVGSVTYRIFIDLAPSSEIVSMYGDAQHAIEFKSDQPFYNHASGDAIPYLNGPLSYQEYTLGLDSWITLGQVATRNLTRFCGVSKGADSNGNYFAGPLNDGSMLSNADASIGLPLTLADGMDTMRFPVGSSSWGVNLPDSSILGPTSTDSVFISNAASIQCDGARGNDSTNQVLVAQLTTAGRLSFKINLSVRQTNGQDTILVDYVASLAPGETPSSTLIPLPVLSYPPACGCTDPDYVEYSSSYLCSIPDSCKNLVKYGCMDTVACNYDPSANFNLPTLCCYPGYCNDRDLTVVCPEILNGRHQFSSLTIGPNPMEESLVVRWLASTGETMAIRLYDLQGVMVRSHSFHADASGGMVVVSVGELPQGIYMISISGLDGNISQRLIKL